MRAKGNNSQVRTALVNGTVEPMSRVEGAVAAIGWEGSRIAMLGSSEEVAAWAGPKARVVDLAGATVLPGLIDTHPHLLHFGLFDQAALSLADATSIADIQARIRGRAAKIGKGEWIVTGPVGEPHYFLRRSYRDLAEGRLPDRHELDAAAPANPVLLAAWGPVTPNVCAMNTAALKEAGISRDTPDRVGDVMVEKDRQGEPTGILRGRVTNYYNFDPFFARVLAKLPLPPPQAWFDGARAAMRAYNAIGVTTVYEGHAMDLMAIEVYRQLRDRGELSVRVLAALEAESMVLPTDSLLSDADLDRNLELAEQLTDRGGEMLRVEGVTIGIGGPCWPGFLRMREPYRGPFGELTRGVDLVPPDHVRRAIAFAARSGVRLNLVVGGLDEQDILLEMLEEEERVNRIAGRGWIVQHAILVEPEQIARYRRLGFACTTCAGFNWGKGELYAERIGEWVLPLLVPLGRWLEAGVPTALGTDWGPKNVFEQVKLAVTGEMAPAGRRNLAPGRTVSRRQAVEMFTRAAAEVLGWPGIGALAPGNLADLVIVDRNPLTASLEELASTRVLRTILAGDVVFDAGCLTTPG